MLDTEQLLGVFVDIADTLVDDFDLVDFLHFLAMTSASVSTAATAGLVLSDDTGQLHYMAASSEDARSMELYELQVSQGPCLDCFRTGVPISVPDLAEEVHRWPDFAPMALDLGVRAVHAFPLRLRRQVLGALNVFADDVGGLGDEEVQVIQSLADVATIGILQQRAISAAETLSTQLQGALDSRITIEQAKGVVAQTLQINMDLAFDRLRSYARAHQLRLTDVARDVVHRRLDPHSWAR